MKVKELFAVTTGPVRWSISESEPPMTGSEFWHKYRMTDDVWNAEIRFGDVHVIPKQEYAIILITLGQ